MFPNASYTGLSITAPEPSVTRAVFPTASNRLNLLLLSPAVRRLITPPNPPGSCV
jgi:hypothetical protein